jgi:hypothetical protein
LETVSGDPEAARACFQEALALQRARGDQEGIGLSVSGIAALDPVEPGVPSNSPDIPTTRTASGSR